MGFFKKFKEAWLASMTFDKLDDEFYEELEEALILADIGASTAADTVAQLRKRVSQKLLTRADEVKDALRDILAEKLDVGDTALRVDTQPSVVLFIGVNGVGKTTLSRCLCGLIREQAGQIQLDGRHLNRKERQKAAFCVMQDVNHQLFSDSVWGECRMSAPDAPDSTVEGVLDNLHLLPFRERHPMSLSGGQKQRLAVATALLSEKPILIFDEPTSGLDFDSMAQVAGLIRRLSDMGKVIFIVTHDFEFVCRTCSRVLHFDEGEMPDDVPVAVEALPKLRELFSVSVSNGKER